jgi:hypothetical protein
MHFSTDDLPPDQQLCAWREQLTCRFGDGELSRPAPGTFRGSIRTVQLGDVSVSDISGDALTFERTERDVSRREPEIYTVGLLLAGAGVVEQDDRGARLGGGDLVLCDSRRPYRIRFETPFRQIVLRCHRAQLEDSPSMPTPVCRR